MAERLALVRYGALALLYVRQGQGEFGLHLRPASTVKHLGAGRATAGLRVETIVSGLDTPWAIAFAPNRRIFITERPGRLRVVQDGMLLPEPVSIVADGPPEFAVASLDVAEVGEGGLLGLALHPDFRRNGWLYLYYTYRSDNEVRNRVVRYLEKGNQLFASSRQVVIDGIPGNIVHNGGRIAFGPDSMLYITTGDAGDQGLAQDRGSLAGKILRINPDGSIPNDNPFPRSPVYSYGHRNPQGLAWQPCTGRL